MSETKQQWYVEAAGGKHAFNLDEFTIGELELIEDYIEGPLLGANLVRANVRVAIAAAVLSRTRGKSFHEVVDELRNEKGGAVVVGIDDDDEPEPAKAAGKKRPTKPASADGEPATAGTQD